MGILLIVFVIAVNAYFWYEHGFQKGVDSKNKNRERVIILQTDINPKGLDFKERVN